MSIDHDSIKANDLLVEGKKQYDADNYEEAVASFDKAIEIKPKFVDVWSSRGDALRRLKKYEEAIASYDKAIEIDQKNASVWRSKGNALQKLERYDDAIACYDKAIEIDPNDDLPVVRGAWNSKGDALQELERYDDAIACYDKAKNVYAWNSKGDVLQELERYDDAIACYDKVIGTAKKRKSDRNSNTIGLAYRNKGTILQKLERYDDALACYDKVIEMFPGDIMTWDNQRIVLEKLESGYDPRCAHCDHYPWTDVFVSGRGWAEHQPRFGHGSSTFNERYKCECKCHDAPTYGKIMRFSLKRKDAETSRYVMHAFKLAVCPFCKRSEFEDSVYNKINDHFHHNPSYTVNGAPLRNELLAEDLKATGAPEREREFDYNNLYEPGEHNINETLLTPCAGNHKHEWYECACGRNVCKISFRNYFGYEISDELFDNDLVDRSHYSERTKALLDEDKHGYGDKYPPFAPKSAEVPTYATMATIEKIWGKLPRYRSNKPWDHPYRNGHSHFPAPKWDKEKTRPNPWKIRDMPEMSEKILSPEDISNYFVEVKEERIRSLEGSFVYDVPGFAESTAEKLLEKFGTPYKVFSATEEEIAKITFGRKYNRNYSETRAKQIRKQLDDYTKEYGSLEDILDKKRKESFTYRDSRNPSYTYSSESFE